VREVEVARAPLAPYREILGPDRIGRLRAEAERLRTLLGARTVWNVNSTAAGGGVAELLHALVPLAQTLEVDVRWLVIDGDPEFFTITKRLCTRIYGADGDGGPLGPAELAHYRRVTDAEAGQLPRWVRSGDVVVVHEAQPAGLVEAARRLGAFVIWRGHTGSDVPNEHTRDGWAFARRFVEAAHATVFLNRQHVPDWAPRPRVIPPSIDPCSPKNVALGGDVAAGILAGVGILAGGPDQPGAEGAEGLPVMVPMPIGADVKVQRPAAVVRDGPPPAAGTPMVVQVSRWDRLKDMAGVLEAFLESGHTGAYLTLAGSEVLGVSDDPEAEEMFDDCRRRWAALPDRDRQRVQLVCLPMTDLRENAVVVNALQQHATVVVQKSLAEGFGLTATEAMWKARPVLASAVGGLKEQVVPGESGLLVGPGDIGSAGVAIRRLLDDPALARRLGAGARRRVDERFLPDRHLLDWSALLHEAASVVTA
jgi:trehalose synthase